MSLKSLKVLALDQLTRKFVEMSLSQFEMEMEKLTETDSVFAKGILSHPLTELLQTVAEDCARGEAEKLSGQFSKLKIAISYRDVRLTCTGGWYNGCNNCGKKVWPWQMKLLRDDSSCDSCGDVREEFGCQDCSVKIQKLRKERQERRVAKNEANRLKQEAENAIKRASKAKKPITYVSPWSVELMTELPCLETY